MTQKYGIKDQFLLYLQIKNVLKTKSKCILLKCNNLFYKQTNKQIRIQRSALRNIQTQTPVCNKYSNCKKNKINKKKGGGGMTIPEQISSSIFSNLHLIQYKLTFREHLTQHKMHKMDFNI